MNYWPAITVSLVFVIIAVLTNDGFEQRWCATYPDWCMPVAAGGLNEWRSGDED